MMPLPQALGRAGDALRRSVDTVRHHPSPLLAPPAPQHDHVVLRPRRPDTARDQSIAALQAVVWIASFVQGFFDEIAGRAPDRDA